MSKAPAFQLYAGDFLTDVMDWTDEQVGAHIRLLCWSWVNRRGIPRDTQRLTRIAPAALSAWPVIGKKWVEGPDDTWVNERLESTRSDSDAFRASQRERSLLALEARRKKYARKSKPKDKPMGSPMGNPLEGEGEVLTQKGKERAHEDPFPDDFPPELRSNEFFEAWQTWEAARMEKRKPIGPTARKLQLADCVKMGQDRAIAALLHSSKAGYQGLFEPLPTRSNGATQHVNGGMTKEQAEEEMRQIRVRNGRDPVMGFVGDDECSRALLIYRGVIKERKVG